VLKIDQNQDGTPEATFNVTANDKGLWSVDLTQPPASGTVPALTNGVVLQLGATATDAAGNTSPESKRALNIDTQAPGQPTITSANQTSDITPLITGTAESNSTVEITIDNKGVQTRFQVQATSSGHWEIDTGANPSQGVPNLADGDTPLITVTATDAAGNASQPVTQTLTIDAAAPTVPTIDSPSAVNTITPTIFGTDEPGSTVTLGIDTNNDGTPDVTYQALVDASGNWSVDLATATPATGTAPNLTDGSRVGISAFATDVAGNVSPTAQQNLTVDTTAPGTPQITSPNLTNDATPVITGTAEPNSNVVINVVAGGVTTTYQVTSNGSGNWTVDLGSATPTTGTTPILTDGSTATITAIATDAVGNASGASAPQTLTVDTGAPGVPTITSPDLVNIVTPTITGTDEPGSTVTLGIDTNSDGTPEAT
jgi:hypothetical protein